MSDTAKILYETSKETGILFVMKSFGNNLKVRLALSNEFCERSIEDINLSVRSRNGLMRCGATTLGHVFDLIMTEGGLSNVRNLGKKSISEIKTSILVYGYDELDDIERLIFWRDFVYNNDLPASVELP